MPGGNLVTEVNGEAKSQLLDLVERQFRAGISDAFSYAKDYPAFLAGPPPGTPGFGLSQKIGQAACRSFARGGGIQNSPAFEAAWAGICGPYLDSIGENPGDGSIGVPFAGGQCPGVVYNIIASWQSVNTDGSLAPEQTQTIGNFAAYPGPIISVEARDTFTQGAGIYVRFGPNGAEEQPRSSSASQGDFRNFKVLSVFRRDGQPDTCGDPPVEYMPPRVPPGLPPNPTVVVNVPGIGDVEVGVEFNPDGSIDIDLPEIGVSLTIPNPLAGEDGGGAPGGGGAGVPPSAEVAAPLDGVIDGDGENDFGPPPEGRVWIGAAVEVLGDLVPWGVVPGSGGGNAALTRVVGNASLVVPGDNSGIIRTTATQIRTQWSDHLLPLNGLTATGIRVNINPALTYRLWRVSINDPNSQED